MLAATVARAFRATQAGDRLRKAPLGQGATRADDARLGPLYPSCDGPWPLILRTSEGVECGAVHSRVVAEYRYPCVP
jgi:hypothetical protein